MVIKRMLESNILVAGGGAVETALSIYLESFATTLGSREQLAIAEFAEALLVIPKTLAVNAAQVSRSWMTDDFLWQQLVALTHCRFVLGVSVVSGVVWCLLCFGAAAAAAAEAAAAETAAAEAAVVVVVVRTSSPSRLDTLGPSQSVSTPTGYTYIHGTPG